MSTEVETKAHEAEIQDPAMKRACEKVSEFQKRIGVQKLTRLADVGIVTRRCLESMAFQLHRINKELKDEYKYEKSSVVLRLELMTEELAEAFDAMIAGDELQLLDALADLCYVVIGTATTFSLPLPEAFDEVHRSNMTKGAAAHDHAGDKGKGAGFSPANLKPILEAARARTQE